MSSNEMIFKPLRAGQFRQRVAIQVPNVVPDGRGGGIHNWSTLATVWAHIRTTSASVTSFGDRATFEEAQLRARSSFIVTLRYDKPITTAMRLIYKGTDLEIESVINVDELNWTVVLFCREMGKGEP